MNMKTRLVSTAVATIIVLSSWMSDAGCRMPDAGYLPEFQITTSSTPHITTSQNRHITTFDALWRRADSLERAGLPKSALDVVMKIYGMAKKEKNDPQYVKAVIYKIRLSSQTTEDPLAASIRDLNGELRNAAGPLSQVLRSVQAELYWRYYQANMYRFRDRTEVAGNIGDSLPTWDLNRLTRQIMKSYMTSLENAEILKKIPIGEWKDVLDMPGKEKQTSDGTRCRPTLYDFLSWRALDYFMSSDGPTSVSVNSFKLDDPFFLSQPGNFTRLKIAIACDSASPESFAINIFRNLATFHFLDKDPRALIDCELQRMSYVREKSGLPYKDTLYFAVLKRFEQGYIQSPASTEISYAIAEYLKEEGEKFNPQEGNLHKWEKREAMKVCEEAMKRFPDSDGAKNCKRLAAEIREPGLSLKTESAIYPGKPALGLAGITNISTMYFRIIKTTPEVLEEAFRNKDEKERIAYIRGLKAIQSWKFVFPSDTDYQAHSGEFRIPPCDPGYYILAASTREDFATGTSTVGYTTFYATRLSYVSHRKKDGGYEFFIPDRESGKPLKGVVAEVMYKAYNPQSHSLETKKMGDLTSDENGMIFVAPSHTSGYNNTLFLNLSLKEDKYTTNSIYVYESGEMPVVPVVNTHLFTDRAIYRPGQPVLFKGIVTEDAGDKHSLKKHFSQVVTFNDANGQKIAEREVMTNNFGSFNGSFTAPLGVLPGQMTISTHSGSVSFHVEEYKRPTFEVTFDPLEGNYRLNDSLTVKGKANAYAGYPLEGARVNYEIVRNARFPYFDFGWFRPWFNAQETVIATGTLETGSDGTFTIRFLASADNTVPKSELPVFDFTVSCGVTDLNGETQSATTDVSVGYTSLLLGSTFPEKTDPEKDTTVTISSTNLNGRKTPATVDVSLQLLKEPGRVLRDRKWEQPDLVTFKEEDFKKEFPNDAYGDEEDASKWPVEKVVLQKIVNTEKDSVIDLRSFGSLKWKPGTYRLVMKAKDPFGSDVETKKEIVIYNAGSGSVPGNPLSWFLPLKSSGVPGETASFLVGSKETDVHMMYEVRVRDTVFSRQWLKISDEQKRIDVPIQPGFRGNFAVSFLFVKHNRMEENSTLVQVPYENKELKFTFELFRNKLEPGQKEEWKIRITDASKKGAEAEMMATMYDASLDVFAPHNWAFSIFQEYFYPQAWESNQSFNFASAEFSPIAFPIPDGINREYPELNWFGMQGYGGGHGRYRTRFAAPMVAEDMVFEKSASNVAEESPPPPPPPLLGEMGAKMKFLKSQKTENYPAPSMRSDFRETAFFYPALETDSTGSLILRFTLPGSLTRWRMLGIAHTKNLEYGLIEKELVAQKKLMVVPNAPRFVRQGDTVIFSTKVVNLTDQDLESTVSLSLSDPLTSAGLDTMIVADQGQKSKVKGQNNNLLSYHLTTLLASIPKNGTSSVSWKIFIPNNPALSLLQFRVTATAGNYSDGEEKVLPVLTNRMLVTETLPLPVNGKGTTDFTFGKLLKSDASQTMKNYNLTLEFTSNPAWYAVQALPVLDEPKYPSADNIFRMYYANSIASFIANSTPKIRQVFESWKSQSPAALLSNLEKNEALKSALLQETPWVMEAKSESQQKQQIALLFDLNTMTDRLAVSLKKLQKLQNSDGSWSWFEGMPASRWITQDIVTGLGHLDHMGVTAVRKDPATWNMLTKAIQYLDGELARDYDNLLMYFSDKMDQDHISATQVQYLYARSYFKDIPVSQTPLPGWGGAGGGAAPRKAFDYFKSQASKYWLQQDLSVQAMIALALDRYGDKEVPAKILRSLSEKAQHSPEMGMYWAGPGGYWWYQAPVETQAMMIEAYDEVAKDTKSVEEMKTWLLKQKQTQRWSTDRATAEACYALLLRGTDLLSADPGVKIKVGKETVDPSKMTDNRPEAGTGYFQVSWTGKEIEPGMGKVAVTKSGEGIAWGALYWQYFEDLDKITPAQTPLKLEKKLFVERSTENGKVLEEITDYGLRITNNNQQINFSPNQFLKIGDRLKVRIILTVDRDMEFVQMKDMRASAFEPPVSEGLSGYNYKDGLGYYQAITDPATSFFFDYLPKGTYVFEYPLTVNAAGDYSNGITTIQCLYAPEFSAHSEGIRVRVLK
jgi:hypothetical protein